MFRVRQQCMNLLVAQLLKRVVPFAHARKGFRRDDRHNFIREAAEPDERIRRRDGNRDDDFGRLVLPQMG